MHPPLQSLASLDLLESGVEYTLHLMTLTNYNIATRLKLVSCTLAAGCFPAGTGLRALLDEVFTH
jgi:hypothetical protein